MVTLLVMFRRRPMNFGRRFMGFCRLRVADRWHIVHSLVFCCFVRGKYVRVAPVKHTTLSRERTTSRGSLRNETGVVALGGAGRAVLVDGQPAVDTKNPQVVACIIATNVSLPDSSRIPAHQSLGCNQ